MCPDVTEDVTLWCKILTSWFQTINVRRLRCFVSKTCRKWIEDAFCYQKMLLPIMAGIPHEQVFKIYFNSTQIFMTAEKGMFWLENMIFEIRTLNPLHVSEPSKLNDTIYLIEEKILSAVAFIEARKGVESLVKALTYPCMIENREKWCNSYMWIPKTTVRTAIVERQSNFNLRIQKRKRDQNLFCICWSIRKNPQRKSSGREKTHFLGTYACKLLARCSYVYSAVN